MPNNCNITGFDAFKEELGPSRESTLQRDMSLDVSYDEQDIMKVRLLSCHGNLSTYSCHGDHCPNNGFHGDWPESFWFAFEFEAETSVAFIESSMI